MLRNVIRLKGIEQKQALYLLVGFSGTASIAIIANAILPAIGISNLTNLGHLSTIITAIFAIYSMLRHRFFSITTLVNNAISTFLNAIVLYVVYFALCFFFINTFNGIFNNAVYVVAFFSSLILTYFIRNILNRIYAIKFFNKKFDPELYIKKLRNNKDYEISSAQILQEFIETSKQYLGLEMKIIFEYENITNNKFLTFISDLNEKTRSKHTKLFLAQEDTTLFNSLIDKEIYSGVVCVYKESTLIYAILMQKREDFSAFDLEDINALNESSERLNLSISRSLLTDEQRRFNEVLQQKLDVATEELRKQKDEVEDRYRTEKDMIGIMGHELRTPLTTARGFLEIIMTKAKANPDTPVNTYQHYMDNIYDAFKREVDLVQTMLSTSHVDNNKLKLDLVEVDLEGIIKGTIQDFLPDAEKKSLGFEYHPMENLPHIKSDPSRTIEVTNNLVSNAVKYTPKGRVDIYVSYDDQFVYFSVKDTGEGIPPEEIPNIGKRFYRVQNYLSADQTIVRPGGTGLGMYIVKAILAAAGGELRIESTVGQGSTFTAVFVRWDGK